MPTDGGLLLRRSPPVPLLRAAPSPLGSAKRHRLFIFFVSPLDLRAFGRRAVPRVASVSPEDHALPFGTTSSCSVQHPSVPGASRPGPANRREHLACRGRPFPYLPRSRRPCYHHRILKFRNSVRVYSLYSLRRPLIDHTSYCCFWCWSVAAGEIPASGHSLKPPPALCALATLSAPSVRSVAVSTVCAAIAAVALSISLAIDAILSSMNRLLRASRGSRWFLWLRIDLLSAGGTRFEEKTPATLPLSLSTPRISPLLWLVFERGCVLVCFCVLRVHLNGDFHFFQVFFCWFFF